MCEVSIEPALSSPEGKLFTEEEADNIVQDALQLAENDELNEYRDGKTKSVCKSENHICSTADASKISITASEDGGED